MAGSSIVQMIERFTTNKTNDVIWIGWGKDLVSHLWLRCRIGDYIVQVPWINCYDDVFDEMREWWLQRIILFHHDIRGILNCWWWWLKPCQLDVRGEKVGTREETKSILKKYHINVWKSAKRRTIRQKIASSLQVEVLRKFFLQRACFRLEVENHAQMRMLSHLNLHRFNSWRFAWNFIHPREKVKDL